MVPKKTPSFIESRQGLLVKVVFTDRQTDRHPTHRTDNKAVTNKKSGYEFEHLDLQGGPN